MYVTRLDIAGLRRFERVSLLPDPGLNLLTGQNGAGKTSVLEALHLMAYGRSFRGSIALACAMADRRGKADWMATPSVILASCVLPSPW